MGLTLAALALATAYSSGLIIILPSVLAVFGKNATASGPNVIIAVAVMLVIAVLGIRLTARTQVGIAVVEYVILVGFAIAGLAAVLAHHGGTFPITRGWFRFGGIGHGGVTAGFLLAVFAFTGWDATIYVNEEVKHRRKNPGRAAMIAVACLAIIYTISTVGLQGVVSPAKLYIAFYVLTALATMVYYRRRILTSVWNGLTLGLLPVAASGFLTWIVVRSIQTAPSAWNWALGITGATGLILLLSARYIQRSSFFQIPRESSD